MKAIKNINNNIALCVDSKGREVIAFGKGIGTEKCPHEVPLNMINRTFYNVKDNEYGDIRSIPTKVINISIEIIDHASEQLGVEFPSSAALSLADHINFAIQRQNSNMYLDMPIIQDLEMLYPEEMQNAYESLQMINQNLNAHLPRSEAGSIALHFVNDRVENFNSRPTSEKTISECMDIIQEHMGKNIQREGFNYSRFVTHFDYMLKRVDEHKQIISTNEDMFELMKTKYQKTYECVEQVAEYLKVELDITLTDEEKMYLILHVNRLCSREQNQ